MRSFAITVKALPIWCKESIESQSTTQRASDVAVAVARALRIFKKERKQVRHQVGRRYTIEIEQIENN